LGAMKVALENYFLSKGCATSVNTLTSWGFKRICYTHQIHCGFQERKGEN